MEKIWRHAFALAAVGTLGVASASLTSAQAGEDEAVAKVSAATAATDASNATDATDATVERKSRASEAERLYRRGRAWAFGFDGRRVDGERGFELLSQAAELGSVDAQGELAVMWFNGWRGVKSDAARAFDLGLEAAEAGNPMGAQIVGVCCRQGRAVAKNEKLARKYFKIAFEGAKERAENDLLAKTTLAELYFDGAGVEQDYAEAARLFREASEAGFARATQGLGVCYAIGAGVERDARQAFELFQKAAELGDAVATGNLGVCYLMGAGVEQDYAEAARLFREASEAGDATATYYWGVCLLEGRGVERDEVEAVRWFRENADWFAPSAEKLSECYEKGLGVAKNREEAEKWRRKAKGDDWFDASIYTGEGTEHKTDATELFREARRRDAQEAATSNESASESSSESASEEDELAAPGLERIGKSSSEAATVEAETIEARGVVTLDGEPLADAYVYFKPCDENGSWAYGLTNEKGEFVLQASLGAELSPGAYRVRFECVKDDELGETIEEDGEEKPETALRPLAPERYGDFETSGIIVEISGKTTKIEIELQSE